MKKILFSLLLCFIIFAAALNAQDAPPEEYIVEKYDNLWDISDSRLEDPFLWPKLWSVNSHIENPDLIYPGSKLIIPTREELMRMLAVPRKPAPASRKQQAYAPKEKVVYVLPEVKKQKYIVPKKLYIASGWIADSYPSIGEIIFSPQDRHILGTEDIVYIKLNKEAEAKKRLFVIRDIKIVKHPVTGRTVGHQIRIAGILEVIGEDRGMIKARVTASYEDIQTGDGLIPYQELEPPLVRTAARTPSLSGYIIESHQNTYLLGEGDIIFLDMGKDNGLAIGDVFSVLSVPPTERPIGEIQVVSLQPGTAGAIVLDIEQEITIGTKWTQKEK